MTPKSLSKLSVIVNQGSASASELLAALLQERGRATILGENTFGKNTVQTQFGLANGGALKLSIARWVTPGGLDFGRQIPEPPRIFSVNWFRKDENGKFLWPGFGENMRILKWIVERARGKSKGFETPLGWMPRYEDMDWRGLDFSKDQWKSVMNLDRDAWIKELSTHDDLFFKLYDRLPKEMTFIRELLVSNLWRSPELGLAAPRPEPAEETKAVAGS